MHCYIVCVALSLNFPNESQDVKIATTVVNERLTGKYIARFEEFIYQDKRFDPIHFICIADLQYKPRAHAVFSSAGFFIPDTIN